MSGTRVKGLQILAQGEAIARALSLPTRWSPAADIVLILMISAAGAAFAVHLFHQLDFLRLCRGFDLWFDSDPGRTVGAVLARGSELHYRSSLHPLWSLFVAAPVGAVSLLGALSPPATISLYVGLQSACLGATAYMALRAFKLAHVDAALGVLVLYSTSATIYWIGVPEWLAFGVASVIVSVIWLAAAPKAQSYATGVAQSVISASMAVTSWAFGIGALLLSRWPKLGWRPAYEGSRDALALLALLTAFQYLVFPRAGGFFAIWWQIGGPNSHPDHTIVEYVAAFFGHTLVAPDVSVIEGVKPVPAPDAARIITSRPWPALTPLTLTVFSLWAALLAIGARAALKGAISAPVAVMTAGGLGYLFLFHSIFGPETFFFSLFFAPFLTFIALWGAATRLRLLVRSLCLVLCAASLAYNYPVFRATAAIHNGIDTSWLEGLPASPLTALTPCGPTSSEPEAES